MSSQRCTLFRVAGFRAIILCGVALALSAIAPAAMAQSANTISDSSYPKVWIDPATQLLWTIEDNGSDISRDAAANYCKALKLSTYSDWRLPTIQELQTIYSTSGKFSMNYYGHRDVIHIKGSLSPTGDSWSSTHGDRPSSGFVFNFLEGKQEGSDASTGKLHRALCVRGTPDAAALARSNTPPLPSSASQPSVANPPESKIDDSSAIAGLNLSMTLAQIRAAVHGKYPHATSSKMTATIALHGKNQTLPIGEYFIITPTHDQFDKDEQLVHSGEFIQILYSPPTNTPFAIIHFHGYRPSEYISRDSVEKALLQKFGPPVQPLSEAKKISNFLWIARTHYKLVGLDHFIFDRQPTDAPKCGMRDLFREVSGLHSFLYENSYHGYMNIEPDLGGENAQLTSDIADAIREPDVYAGCGLILEAAVFESGNDRDRANEIMEKFVDFDKASEAFQALSDWAKKMDQENRANEKKSAVKPDL